MHHMVLRRRLGTLGRLAKRRIVLRRVVPQAQLSFGMNSLVLQ